MTKVLLSIHVLAAILAIGPVTVAASMFPRYAAQAFAAPADLAIRSVVQTLHRICRVYSVLGIFVPAFGLMTAISLGVLTDTWLIVSIILTAVAAVLLVASLLPAQRAILASLDDDVADPSDGMPATISRLRMVTGLFSLLWAIVTILMIARPGSTTGA